jgi:hypothetical protein
MECKYCKNNFTTKTSLNNHQKTAKYCMSLRNIKIEQSYKCDGCGKIFSRNYHLSRHEQKCRSNDRLYQLEQEVEKQKQECKEYKIQVQEKDKLLSKYEITIRDLQDKLENVAIKAVSRPVMSNKTQINNYIQQMQPVTDELLKDSVKHLTIDHIKKGAEGYAEYALEYPLKDRMLCSDYSRRKVKFKDNEGNVITDPEMSVLARKFFNSIKDKNKELICKSANELKERLGDDNVMDTVVKMFDYKSDIEKGSDGEKTEFHHDFVKQVCSQSIKE